MVTYKMDGLWPQGSWELRPRNRSSPQTHEKCQSAQRQNPDKCEYGVGASAAMGSPVQGNEREIAGEEQCKNSHAESERPKRGSHFLEARDVSGNHTGCLFHYVCVIWERSVRASSLGLRLP